MWSELLPWMLASVSATVTIWACFDRLKRIEELERIVQRQQDRLWVHLEFVRAACEAKDMDAFDAVFGRYYASMKELDKRYKQEDAQ